MPTVHLTANILLMLLAATVSGVVARRRSRRVAGAVIAVAVFLGVGGWLMTFRPDLLLGVVPFTHLMFYTDMYPLAVAVAIPGIVVLAKTRAQRWRFGCWSLLLLVVALSSWRDHWRPAAGSNGTTIDSDGVCRQSSAETCAAAAVVTLLHHHGIACTESEAVTLSQTKDGAGTLPLGVYRALRIKTAGDDRLRVRLRHRPLEALMADTQPSIITVGIGRRATAEAEAFAAKYQWQRGSLHDVVCLGADPDRPGLVRVADPDIGLESWPVEHLRYLYQGYATTLWE